MTTLSDLITGDAGKVVPTDVTPEQKASMATKIAQQQGNQLPQGWKFDDAPAENKGAQIASELKPQNSGLPTGWKFDDQTEQEKTPQTELSTWTPSTGEKIVDWWHHLFGMNQRDIARAMNQYAEQRSNITPAQARESVGGMSEIPEQFVSKGVHTATLGAIPDVAGSAQTTSGGVAGGAGQLTGFMLGAPVKIAQALVAPVTKGATLSHIAGESFVSALSKDVASQAATLGVAGSLSEVGNALDSPDVATAFKKEASALANNAKTGAIFGVAGRVLPDTTLAQGVARAVGVSAALDAANGKRPFEDIQNFDQLSPEEKGSAIFNYGMNLLFTLKGAGRTSGGWMQSEKTAPESQQLSPHEQAKADAEVLQSGQEIPDADPQRIKNASLVAMMGDNKAVEHAIDSGNQQIIDSMLQVSPRAADALEKIKAKAAEAEPTAMSQAFANAKIKPTEAAKETPAETPAEAPKFQTPEEVSTQGFTDKAQSLGLTPEQSAALAPAHVTDHVTGFERAEEKVPTVKRAQQFAQDTGQSAHFVDADIANLSGLNSFFGNDASKANVVFRGISDIFADEMKKAGVKSVPIRHGGDEISAVVIGGTKDSINAAIENTKARVADYVHEQGLADIEHPKHIGNKMMAGVGLHMGQSEIGPKDSLADIFDRASKGVDASKKGAPFIERRAQPAQPVAAETPAAQPARPLSRVEMIKAEKAANVEKIAEASKAAAHHPENAAPLPTEAQHAAGNYPKGHVNLNGLDITIENPKGSVRTGMAEGKPWQVKMQNPYGYIRKTEGADGDHMDVYLGDHITKDSPAFVIDQVDPKTGKFDEHKIVYGARGYAEAKDIYDTHFADKSGPSRRATVSKMSLDELKTWLKGDTTKPLKYKERPQAEEDEPANVNQPKSLLGTIKGMGGVSKDEISDITGERRVGKGIAGIPPGLFRNDGAGLDDLATRLRDVGYDIDTNSPDGGVQQLREMIADEINGVRKHYTSADQETEFEKLFTERYKEQENAPEATQAEPPKPKKTAAQAAESVLAARKLYAYPTEAAAISAEKRQRTQGFDEGKVIPHPTEKGKFAVVPAHEPMKLEQKAEEYDAEKKTLIIQHNLSVENLLHAEKMGGIPVPSLAITQAEHPLTGFGEITLLGGMDMADPKGYAKTKVFGADIYSPRYPQVNYHVKYKDVDALNKKFSEDKQATRSDGVGMDDIEREGVRAFEYSAPFMHRFLKENGIEPKIVKKEITPLPKALEEFASDKRDNFDLSKDPKFIEAAYKAWGERLAEAHKDDEGFTEKDIKAEIDHLKERAKDIGRNYVAEDAARKVVDHRRDQVANGAVDTYRTKDALRRQIEENKLVDKYNEYAKEILASLNPEEKIFRGFTNSGNRKYVAHTLDNVISILKKELRGGENFNYGAGNVRAMFTPEFKSIAQIRKAKDRLMTEEKFNEVKDDINNELTDLGEGLSKYHPIGNEYRFMDTLTNTLYDAAKMGLPRAFKENGFKDVPPEKIQEVAQFLEKLRNLPTQYFEAKILRGVDLSEFKGAVVPEGTSQKALNALKNRGITRIEKYKNNDNEDRAAKIQKLSDEAGLLFQKETPYNETHEANQVEPDIYADREVRPDTTEKQKQLGRDAYREILSAYARRRGANVLGSRIAKDFQEQGGTALHGQEAKTPEDFAVLAQVLRDPRFEKFRIFYTKGDKIVGHDAMTSNDPGSVSVIKRLPGESYNIAEQRTYNDMFDKKERLGADGYWLLHNHPAGRAEPSGADLRLTARIAKELPGFKGHIVIDHNEYTYIDANAGHETIQKEMPQYFSHNVPEIPHNALGMKLSKKEDVVIIGKMLENKEGFFSLIGRTARGEVSAIAEFPRALFDEGISQEMHLRSALRRFATQTGSYDITAVIDRSDIGRAEKFVEKGLLLDAVDQNGYSVRDFVTPQERSLFQNAKQYTIDQPTAPYGKSRLVRQGEEKPEETVMDKAKHFIGKVKDSFDELKKAYVSAPEFTETKKIIGEYTGKLQEIDYGLSRLAHSINKEYPRDRQEAITNYIQAGGDEAVLRERAAKSPEQFRKGYEDAINLSPKEKELAEFIQKQQDDYWKKANEAGIIEHYIDNYVRGQWERENPAGQKIIALVNSGMLNDHPREAMQKVFQNYAEGEQAGFIPKDKRIGFQFVAGNRSIRAAIAAREALTALMHSTEKDGRPTVAIGGGGSIMEAGAEEKPYFVKPNIKPKDSLDYKTIDHPALRGWKWVGSDAEGKPILMHGQMYIHPDAYGKLNALLGKSKVRTFELPKNIPVVGGTRPGEAMLKTGAFIKSTILIGPFHQFHLGEHAVFHGVNPVGVPEINFDERPALREGIYHGLMLYNHNAMHEFAEGLSTGGLWHRLPVVGDGLKRYQEWLFQDYIPRLKAAMFEKALARAEEEYAEHLRSGKLTRDQLLDNVAKQANAAFGEMNYKYMARDPSYQDALRIALLAPDFLEARMKFFAQAVRPYGKEQAMALVRGAAIMALGAQTINMMFGDDKKMHWDRPFSVIINGREYSPRSVVGDIAHLVEDPRGFWFHRINPLWGRPLYELSTGRNVQGQKETLDEGIENILKSWVPIPAQGIFKDQPELTMTQSIVNTLLQSIGVSNFQTKSPAEKMIHDFNFDKMPQVAMTDAQMEKRKALRAIEAKIRLGEQDKAQQLFQEGQAKHIITGKDYAMVIRRSTRPQIVNAFKHLDYDQAQKVWEVASPEEKKILELAYAEKKIAAVKKNAQLGINPP